MGRLLEMGTVGRAHGIRGELALVWQGEQNPFPGLELLLELPGGGRKKFRVLSSRMHKGMPLATLEGLSDRSMAETLKGAKIYVEADQLNAPADDETWLAELIGMEVCLEDGALLGRLDHVEFPAGREIWAIIDEKGREILFPAQPCFLAGVDQEQGRVFIRPPEGLLEIYNNA